MFMWSTEATKFNVELKIQAFRRAHSSPWPSCQDCRAWTSLRYALFQCYSEGGYWHSCLGWWEHLRCLRPQQSAGHWQYRDNSYWRGRIDITDWHSWVLFGLSEFCCSYWMECTPFCNDKVRSGFLSFLCQQAIPNLISHPNSGTWFKC